MCGRTRPGPRGERVYYACGTNRAQHDHKPWYAEHPSTLTITERLVLPVVGGFFAGHVLGPDRVRQLATMSPAPAPDETEARAVQAQITALDRARTNLLAQLEAFEPTGDDDTDTEWRASLQQRFAAIIALRRQAAARATALQAQHATHPGPAGEQAAVLNLLPVTSRDLTELPEQIQRQLYDAFHLQIRYHHAQRRVTIQVTVSASTVQGLADSITTAVGHAAIQVCIWSVPPAGDVTDLQPTATSPVTVSADFLLP
jgi:hypothetical protein